MEGREAAPSNLTTNHTNHTNKRAIACRGLIRTVTFVWFVWFVVKMTEPPLARTLSA